MCVACGQIPGQPGCKKIGSHFRIEGVEFFVDHTPTEPVVHVDQQRCGGNLEITIPLDRDETDVHAENVQTSTMTRQQQE